MTMTSNSEPIVLTHKDNRQVMFETEGGDRFFKNTSQAIVAQQRDELLNEHLKNTSETLRQFAMRLFDWAEGHRSKISTAYLSQNNGSFSFVVLQRTIEVDVALETSLIDLDIEIAHDPRFERLRLDVLLLPRCDDACVSTFVRGERLKHDFEKDEVGESVQNANS